MTDTEPRTAIGMLKTAIARWEHANSNSGLSTFLMMERELVDALRHALAALAIESEARATAPAGLREAATDMCGAILNCTLPINHDGLHERADGVRWSWHENIDHLPRR